MPQLPAPALPDRADVVVVGAGLAGLNAARELVQAKRDVVVIEASDDVGGRVRTDEVDGFRLDRGFQLYNPAYPEAARVLAEGALDLRPFARGVRVIRGARTATLADPTRAPQLAPALRHVPGGLLAGARFAAYATTAAALPAGRLARRPDEPVAAVLLRTTGSRALVEGLLRPFLSGVFAEDQLATSRRFADFVLRSFVRGTPALPATGMQAVPDLLAGDVGRQRIHLATSARSVTATSVTTGTGTVAASRVIVATDPATAARLVPGLRAPRMNALTTWYFATSAESVPSSQRYLVVDGDPGRFVANIALVSDVAPRYAPVGQTLAAVSAVGHQNDDDRAAAELRRLVGGRGWRLLRRYQIDEALPAAQPPFELRRGQDFGGIAVAGDHRDTPSIQGALVSGRRAARTVLRDLSRR